MQTSFNSFNKKISCSGVDTQIVLMVSGEKKKNLLTKSDHNSSKKPQHSLYTEVGLEGFVQKVNLKIGDCLPFVL